MLNEFDKQWYRDNLVKNSNNLLGNFSFENIKEFIEQMKKSKEISEKKSKEVIQKIKKEKLKIGLINVCTLAAKNKEVDKKADIREIFDDDMELDMLVCTETNIDD